MKKILIAMLASCPLLLQADQLINDDKIVIGNSCIGQDCINGENFSQMGVLKLKENNLRIHFFPDIDFSGVGKEWLIEANDSRNGGLNYFTFQSVDPDSEVAKLSDGYDSEIICDKWVNSYYTGNLIPVGDPVYEVVSQEARIGNLSVCQVSDTEVSDGSAQKPVCGEVFENGNYTGLYDGVIPQGEPVVIIASFEQGIWQKFTCQQAMTVKVEDRIFLPINDMQSIGLTGSKKDQPFTVAAGSENVLLQLKNIQQ